MEGERLQITCLAFSSNTEAYNIFSRFSLFCYFFLVYWLNIQHYASALFTPLVNNITSSSSAIVSHRFRSSLFAHIVLSSNLIKNILLFFFYCLSYQLFSFCGELIVSYKLPCPSKNGRSEQMICPRLVFPFCRCLFQSLSIFFQWYVYDIVFGPMNHSVASAFVWSSNICMPQKLSRRIAV